MSVSVLTETLPKRLGGHDYPYCPVFRRERLSVEYKKLNKLLFIFFQEKKTLC